MRSKDGTWRWILGRGKAASRDAEGKARLIVGTHVDITERKQIEQKIITAKEEWENTFDAITELIFIHDGDGRIMRANKAYEQRMTVLLTHAGRQRFQENLCQKNS
jgi:PAS domain-containing protein